MLSISIYYAKMAPKSDSHNSQIQMNVLHHKLLLAILYFSPAMLVAEQPNVLWLLTDDQRYDSIRAFNRILHDREHSELGYVESPNVDRLAAMGTTFINSYCHSAVCAPSRAAMHYGRYPFRSGIYEFEYHNNNLKHCRPTIPEQMVKLGYQTLHIGKLGVRIRTIKNGKARPHPIYQQDIDSKLLAKEGLADWGKGWFNQLDGKKLEKPLAGVEFFITPNGKFEYTNPALETIERYRGQSKRVDEKYDLLRHFNQRKPKAYGSGMALAGVSPRAAGKTRDGYYSSVFVDYLDNSGRQFDVGSKEFNGVDPSKPLFCHIGFDFPHTPVIPPRDYRERFQQKTYKIPEFDETELDQMAKQIRNFLKNGFSDHLTDEQKQTMIQDYYAFCAYGDRLIGQSVDAFIKYSEQQNQAWVIVYVCGDHGWKLNDHGAVSKCTPWDIDCHNPIIVVSSDKATFPAGKVVGDFTEFVDIAPTILSLGGADLQREEYAYLDGRDMAATVQGKLPARDYVIGESHAATGPRAWIRTKNYVLSLQTRPNKKRGKKFSWAMNASYQELDPALYHMPSDPKEVNNVAFEPQYQAIAKVLKRKLLDVVMGDRIEVDWGKWGEGTQFYRSEFPAGAHDGKLDLE